MESYKNDFLKDEEETFNFERFGVKLTEMSIVNASLAQNPLLIMIFLSPLKFQRATNLKDTKRRIIEQDYPQCIPKENYLTKLSPTICLRQDLWPI